MQSSFVAIVQVRIQGIMWTGRHPRLFEPGTFYVLAIAVFVFGWSKFFASGNGVYVLDVVFRLVVCLFVYLGGGFDGAFVRPVPLWRAAALSVAVLFAVLVTDVVYLWLWYYAFWDSFVHFSVPDSVVLMVFDLTVGIALVAVSEEVVFRRLAERAMAGMKRRTIMLYGVSSVIFGLIHLPRGPALVVMAALTGIVLMWLYRTTRSLWPPVIVHYLFDVIVFTGVGCPIRFGWCVVPW